MAKYSLPPEVGGPGGEAGVVVAAESDWEKCMWPLLIAMISVK